MDNPLIRIEPGLFIWTIITFLVLLAFLGKFAWKPLLQVLNRREKMIRQSLEDAEKARLEAERISLEYKEMIQKARAEVQALVAEGKATSEKMKDKIMKEAREKSEKVRKAAEKRIQAEKESALAEIREEVVNLSVHAASRIIKRNLTKEDNLSIIESSLDEMGKADA